MKKGLITGALLGTLLLALILAAPTLAGSKARWPASPGKSVKKNGKLQVDVANINDGYFQAALRQSTSKKMKLRVKKGSETLTYDLNGKAQYEVFPLQLGSGKYEITLYENVSGKKYSAAGTVSVQVKFKDPEVCFYYPNQQVNYTQKTAAVAEADRLCEGKNNQQTFDTVCNFMKKSFVYDYMKAINIKAGILPDIDTAWNKHMGICQDLSAIMCCMLRTQGLPARLMIGMADRNYHAWVVVKFDGQDHFFDPTAAINGISNVKKYTVERYY